MKLRARLTKVGVVMSALWFKLMAAAYAADPFGQTRLQGVGKYVYGGEAEAQRAGDLTVVIGQIIKSAIGLLGMIFLVMIVYAGYLWLMARGNEETVKNAKATMFRALMGVIIVITAYAITTFVFERLTRLPAAT